MAERKQVDDMTSKQDSDEARTILANKVDELRRHEIQFWQFLFGQVPNCKDIVPTATSWCGGVTSGIASVHRTLYLLFFLILVNSGVANSAKIVELLKWMVR